MPVKKKWSGESRIEDISMTEDTTKQFTISVTNRGDSLVTDGRGLKKWISKDSGGSALYFSDYNEAIEKLREWCKEFATEEP